MLKNELTNAELLVMKCIWDTPKDLVLSEIVAMVNERYNKDWKPQTVSTYLAHLVQKGFLEMTRNGKIYTYHPQVTEIDYRTKEMEIFVNFWGGGSPSAFLAAFFASNKVDAEEIAKLKEVIAGLEK